MVSSGGSIQSITTDGIDYKLGNLKDPTNCTAFMFQQDGHLIYQFTFITDNISYAYDFETKLFFNVSDENLNYHIAREVVYFNNSYYFVSLNGGNIYLFDTILTDAIYSAPTASVVNMQQLPRIRITPPFRLPTQRMFIIKSIGFTIENGEPNPYTETNATEADSTLYLSQALVNLSTSRNGGQSFGSSWGLNMNPTGARQSRFIWQRIGQANDITFQFVFYGFQRFVVFDGIMEVYQ